jgi:hypothetical protein
MPSKLKPVLVCPKTEKIKKIFHGTVNYLACVRDENINVSAFLVADARALNSSDVVQ